MKQKISLIIFILTMSMYSFSQTPSWQWAKTAGTNGTGTGTGSAIDASGNVYITGYFSNSITLGATTLTSVGNNDIFMAKYDSTGTVQWAKSIGGTGDDRGYGIATDKNGNVFVTGNTSSAGISFGSIAVATAGFFIAKYNAAGTVLWAKGGGGASYHNNGGNCIATDTSGNVSVIGSFPASLTFGSTILTNTGNPDIFVAKFDGTGTALWAASGDGGIADYNNGNGIATDETGAIYITGSCGVHTVFGGFLWGVEGMFVTKYNASGTPQWVYGANSGGGVCSGINVSNGYVHVVGWFTNASINCGPYTAINSNAGNSDILLARFYANNGNPAGVWSMGGNRDDEAYNITTDATGDMYMTGRFQSASLAIPPIYTLTNTNPGQENLFVIKYPASFFGNVASWVKSASAGNSKGYGICTDASGSNIYVTGNYFIASTFGSTTITSTSGDYDIFTARLGTTILPVQLASYSIVQKENTVINTWQTLAEINTAYFSVERSNNNKDFMPIGKVIAKGTGNYSFIDTDIPNNTTLYYRLAITDKDGSTQYSAMQKIHSKTTHADIIVFPNPCTEYITILGNCSKITIRDNRGCTVLSRQLDIQQPNTTIRINTLSKGIYFMQCNTNEKVITKKIVIE